jgi:LmbE family N-acetylglucosaminyl deacetylase
VSTKPSQNALILAPHPDDETLGCGGTIKLISSGGGHVEVVFLTRGELGLEPGTEAAQAACDGLAERRTQEALAACQLLGIANATFLDGPDGRLHTQPELSANLANLLESHDYRSVFAPWPRDGHSDHATTFELLRAALMHSGKELDVWLYEVWTPLEPNMIIPIDSTIEAKREAIRAYQSQLETMDYLTAFQALAQYRSLLCAPAKYAEAFFTCDSTALLDGRDFPWLARQQLTAPPRYQ